MSDVYLRKDLLEVKSTGIVPRREWDLVEFYKLTKAKYDVVGILMDIEDHTISFIVRPKK